MAYLAATAAAAVGMAGRIPRGVEAGVVLVGVGALLHAFAIWGLHAEDPVPQLTDLPFAVSLMAWLSVVTYLAMLLLFRGRGMVVAVAPLAFSGAIFASFGFDVDVRQGVDDHPFWSHLHVLLASAGLSVLSLAGVAGLLYLVRDRQLKSKRKSSGRSGLPSLETLDRVLAVTLAFGFLLLTAGLATGVLWVNALTGGFWPSGWHANATFVAWLTYAAIVGVRFWRPRSARSAASGATAAFGILLAAVIGVQVLP